MHFAFLSLSLLLLANGAAAEQSAKIDAKKLSTKSVMHEIFEPVSQLTPMSIEIGGFASGKNHNKIHKNLLKLAASAGKLEDHAKGKDVAFQFISSSLARDAKEMLYWFDKRRYDESQFIFNNLTENCIGCHSLRAGSGNFPPAKDFFKNVAVKKLKPLDRAQLEVSTRQFDDALNTYETFFSSNDRTPSQMSLMESFSDYLKLCIRIKAEPARAIPLLQKWMLRADIPEYMLININYWIASLQDINDRKLLTSDRLSDARKLFEFAQKDPYLTMDRSKLVYFIAASGVLVRFLESQKGTAEENAEAYYLMGICESIIGRSFWLSQTEFFLEAAVRSAPGSATATKAYALLEEQIYYEFSGSSGAHIPEDMRVLLDELRVLAKNKVN